MTNQPPTPAPRPDLLRVSYDDYRALPAIANSDLSRLRDALNGRPPRVDSGSGALSFGTAFHTALLEPSDYQPGQPYTVIDFKTTMARDAEHFRWQCSAYDYDRQAAFYTDALRAERFLLVGVQKVEPFGVFPLEVPTDMLAEGRRKYMQLLKLLRAPATAPAFRAEAVQAAVTALGL